MNAALLFLSIGLAVGQPPAALPTPASELRAALADARRLDSHTASLTRYMTIFHLVVEAERTKTRLTLDYWPNKISRRRDLARVRAVSATLFAVQIDNYRWNPKTWEALAAEDFIFHEQIEVVAGQVGTFWAEGKYQNATMQAAGTVTVLAPWMPEKESIELSLLTQSAVPIVLGDWWLSRSMIQEGRKGTGYYDWLEIKDRDDFDKSVDLDVKKSQELEFDLGDVVSRSGVSRFPRQIERLQARTGGYWRTKDVITDSKGPRNAQQNLDPADYRHEAEEIMAPGANSLLRNFLGDQNGKRQDSAPDGIGPDTRSGLVDKKIHAGFTCDRCHDGGLKPISSWIKGVYHKGTGLKLGAKDVHQLDRLQRKYLTDLQADFAADEARNAAAVRALTGKTPKVMSATAGEVYELYVGRNVTPADGGRYVGLTEVEYVTNLKAYFSAAKNKALLSDNILASHVAGIAIRSDDFEQIFHLVAPAVIGVYK